MRRPFPLLAAALVAVGLFVAGLGVAASGSTSTKLAARLAAGAETPRPKGASRASGLFTATLTGSSLSWRLTFARLTGKAIAAHVHLGRPGVAGPVAVPLCGPCVSGAHGTRKLTVKVRSALLSSGAYVNVHTAKNPAGEIRGQVRSGRPAPTSTTTESEPTTTDDGGYGGYGG
jgi:CHRD domain